MGVFIAWVAFSILVVFFANSKGRSGCAWFFISLLISPLLAVIIIACIGDTDEKRVENIKSTMDIVKEKQEEDKKTAESGEMNEEKAIEELKKAKSLLDLEVITKEEYEAKKAELSQYIRK